MAGEFAQSLPFAWRSKHYPITRIHLSLAHDLAIHAYWGVDGARVEDTGLAPTRIAATIPLGNSIFPGKKEKWTPGKLYPAALRELLVDFAKRETGILQHPEFGEMTCRAERLDFELAGDKQDCTEVHASWVETIDDEQAKLSFIFSTSPVQSLQQAAADLTASMTDLRAKTPHLPEFKDDIESLGRKLTSIVDQVTVLSYRASGVVNRILYQVHRMQVAIERAKNALTWPAMQNIQRIKAACYTLRRQLLRPGGVGLFTVPEAGTLGRVLTQLPKGTAMADVIKLNPDLARRPVVAKGTLVRYPLAA